MRRGGERGSAVPLIALVVLAIGGAVAVAGLDPTGLIVRVEPADVQRITASGAQAGLCPSPGRGPGWFEICPSGQG